VFINPIKEEIAVVAKILEIFGHAFGLITKKDKCVVYPILCDQVDLEDVMTPFQCAILPCSYLPGCHDVLSLQLPGFASALQAAQSSSVQPLIDKMANILPMWRGRFLIRAGGLKLVNSVLSSISTYFLTIFSIKKWAFKKWTKFIEVSCGKVQKM
jgi:hypothetical protein